MWALIICVLYSVSVTWTRSACVADVMSWGNCFCSPLVKNKQTWPCPVELINLKPRSTSSHFTSPIPLLRGSLVCHTDFRTSFLHCSVFRCPLGLDKLQAWKKCLCCTNLTEQSWWWLFRRVQGFGENVLHSFPTCTFFILLFLKWTLAHAH